VQSIRCNQATQLALFKVSLLESWSFSAWLSSFRYVSGAPCHNSQMTRSPNASTQLWKLSSPCWITFHSFSSGSLSSYPDTGSYSSSCKSKCTFYYLKLVIVTACITHLMWSSALFCRQSFWSCFTRSTSNNALLISFWLIGRDLRLIRSKNLANLISRKELMPGEAFYLSTNLMSCRPIRLSVSNSLCSLMPSSWTVLASDTSRARIQISTTSPTSHQRITFSTSSSQRLWCTWLV
jgi:hypothetical protein